MARSRRATLAALVALSLAGAGARAQGSPEAALRQAVAGYLDAWNSKQPDRLRPLLVPDVNWVALYEQPKNDRESVLVYAQNAMNLYALNLAVSRIKLRDNGTSASVLLKGQFMEFPFKDGKYTRVWDRGAILTRWRLDGGRWLIAYMNENANLSGALEKTEGF